MNEADKDGRKPIFQGYIEHTTGIWLRHNIDLKEMELWCEGKLVSAYLYEGKAKPELSFDEPLIRAFITDALMHGKKLRSQEFRDFING